MSYKKATEMYIRGHKEEIEKTIKAYKIMENEKISKELVRAVIKKHKQKAIREMANEVFRECEKVLTNKMPIPSSIAYVSQRDYSFLASKFEMLMQCYPDTFIDNFDLIPKDTKLHEEFYNFLDKYKDEQ